jgi:hypothetical protein
LLVIPEGNAFLFVIPEVNCVSRCHSRRESAFDFPNRG